MRRWRQYTRREPTSARDWPELRVDAVVVDPDMPWRLLVLVRWPERPGPRAVLLLDTSGATTRVESLLQSWRDEGATVAPNRHGDSGVVLRRRRCPEQVRARVLAELRAA
ncbi:MAG TPA: hypothetical protein VFR41_07115 [Acidimicrobiia bacterium]|nr:hypothetical protein [Acidimicrobiia bacterium]